MKKLMIAVVVTGVVIAVAVIKTAKIIKASNSEGMESLSGHENSKEITSDFLL